MALLGLLLILASGALAAGIALGTTGDTSVQVAWFDQVTRSVTQGGLFGLGVAAGVAFLLGLALLRRGAARGRRRRLERKAAAAQQREQARELEERNAELEQKLAQTRAAAERQRTAPTPYPDEPAVATTTTAPDSSEPDSSEPVTSGRHRRR